MELSNALIYGDRLCCGSAEVANATLTLSTSTSNSLWLKKVSVLFLNILKIRGILKQLRASYHIYLCLGLCIYLSFIQVKTLDNWRQWHLVIQLALA